jgi:hypothetical protein
LTSLHIFETSKKHVECFEMVIERTLFSFKKSDNEHAINY